MLPEAGIPSTDKQPQPTEYCGMQLHNPSEIPAPRQQRPHVSISEYQYSQILTLQAECCDRDIQIISFNDINISLTNVATLNNVFSLFITFRKDSVLTTDFTLNFLLRRLK